MCVCEPWWGFFLECSPPIYRTTLSSLRAFSRSLTATPTCEPWSFFSVSLSQVVKLLVHAAVCDFWCCGVVFFYSGRGLIFIGISRDATVRGRGCSVAVGWVFWGVGGSVRPQRLVPPLPPHGKWSSQYIYTSLKPLLKTDDCSFRAQWISTNILDCSNWLCAIVTMEIQ